MFFLLIFISYKKNNSKNSKKYKPTLSILYIYISLINILEALSYYIKVLSYSSHLLALLYN